MLRTIGKRLLALMAILGVGVAVIIMRKRSSISLLIAFVAEESPVKSKYKVRSTTGVIFLKREYLENCVSFDYYKNLIIVKTLLFLKHSCASAVYNILVILH